MGTLRRTRIQLKATLGHVVITLKCFQIFGSSRWGNIHVSVGSWISCCHGCVTVNVKIQDVLVVVVYDPSRVVHAALVLSDTGARLGTMRFLSS